MDRETAERLTALEIEMTALQEEKKAWNDLIREAVVRTVTWLVMAGAAGALYGWHLPENVRKFIAEQIPK